MRPPLAESRIQRVSGMRHERRHGGSHWRPYKAPGGCGGETMTPLEALGRYRNDGSCEREIMDALADRDRLQRELSAALEKLKAAETRFAKIEALAMDSDDDRISALANQGRIDAARKEHA